MPVLVSGFCIAISDNTRYFDMNSAVLAKIEKNHCNAGIADGQYAQDAGVSFFEHILVCTNSMAEATVQTLPVRNCVVCSIAYPLFSFPIFKTG